MQSKSLSHIQVTMTSEAKAEDAVNVIGETGDGSMVTNASANVTKMDEHIASSSEGGGARSRDSGDELQCPICMDTFIDPTITDCSHTFCRFCITHWFANRGRSICPQCRNIVTCILPAQDLQTKVEAFVAANYSKEMLEERQRTIEARQQQDEVGFTPDEMAILDEYLALEGQADDGNQEEFFWQITSGSPEAAAANFAVWSTSGLMPSTVYTTLADTFQAAVELPGPETQAEQPPVTSERVVNQNSIQGTLQQFEDRIERAQRAYNTLVSAQRDMNYQLEHLHILSQSLDRYNNQLMRTRLHGSSNDDSRESRFEIPTGGHRRCSDPLLSSQSDFHLGGIGTSGNNPRSNAYTWTSLSPPRRDPSTDHRPTRYPPRTHQSGHHLCGNNIDHLLSNNQETSNGRCNHENRSSSFHRSANPSFCSSSSDVHRPCNRRCSNSPGVLSDLLSENYRDTTMPSLGISVRSTSSLNIFRPRHRRTRRCCTPIEITTTFFGDDPVSGLLNRDSPQTQEYTDSLRPLMMEIMESPSWSGGVSRAPSSTRDILDIQLPSLTSDTYSSDSFNIPESLTDSPFRRCILLNPGRRYSHNHSSR